MDPYAVSDIAAEIGQGGAKSKGVAMCIELVLVQAVSFEHSLIEVSLMCHYV